MSNGDQTTLAVRDALSGQQASLQWLVERFTPLLLAQARHRLKRHLSGKYDAEDLVQDVWLITLPKLAELRPRNGRMTPVLLRFLSEVLVNRYGTLLQKFVHGKPMDRPVEDHLLAASSTAALDRACRSEEFETVLRCLENLSERDRRVLILRGIEQANNEEAAEILGMTASHVAVVYHRSLTKLRDRLPSSVFEDLATP
ncbi:MAG: RNA polymerase sigma factor [Planctomycetota bacterium]